MTLAPTSMTNSYPSNDLLIRKGYFEPLFLIREHLAAVTACELITVGSEEADDKIYLLTGDVAGFLMIHVLREQRKLAELKFNDGILCIRGFDDSSILVHCRNGKVYSFSMHELESLKAKPLLSCGGHTFCQMDTIEHRGQKLAILPSLGTIDGIDLWNVSTNEIMLCGIQSKDEKSGNVICAKFAKNANEELSILLGTDDGVLRGYQLSLSDLKESNKAEESIRLKLVKQTVTCISHDQASDSLAVGGPHTDLVFIKNALQKDHCTILRTQVCAEGFSDVTTSQGLLITGGWDGKIRFFNVDDLSLLALSNVHSDTILSLRTFQLASGLRDFKRPSIKHANLMIVTSQDKLVSIFSMSPIHQLKEQRASHNV